MLACYIIASEVAGIRAGLEARGGHVSVLAVLCRVQGGTQAGLEARGVHVSVLDVLHRVQRRHEEPLG